MSACVSDKVCNKNLTPVLQARRADPCDRHRCQQATQHFYGSMPQNVAEMLAMLASWKSSSGPSKPPKNSESEHGHTWLHDYLLYAFATVLLVGVVILMPLAIVSKIWMMRKRDNTKFHHPQKSNSVVIF
ncbi:GDNF family receptor alpha-like protein [Lates japonicus]|uniref:GDNF family receptor alpha-like protein n=1 Tax=Lates japonicus TaxID=270547 RepID=A0AAD3RFA7_LATJO|nr:GDNF family receptor alpha-like protein [Lates japonicus]